MLLSMTMRRSGAPPTDPERLILSLLLHADERRCSTASLRRLALRGWVGPGEGGAYRLTATGRELAESLEVPVRPGGA